MFVHQKTVLFYLYFICHKQLINPYKNFIRQVSIIFHIMLIVGGKKAEVKPHLGESSSEKKLEVDMHSPVRYVSENNSDSELRYPPLPNTKP